MSSFKLVHNFEQRKSESNKIFEKYPDRIPIVLEKCTNSNLPEIDKTKYLVPMDLTATQFIYVVRKRLQITQQQSLYLYINNTVPSYHETLADVYKGHKDEDGFLYIQYSDINIVPSSPNPMELLVNLALLKFSKEGSKLSYYNGKLYIDKPDMYQGLNRWLYSSSRDDLIKFDVSLVQTLNIYYRKSNKKIFEFALDGLQKLKKTYTNDEIIQNVLTNDISIMKNYMEKYNEHNDDDALINNILIKINELFEKLDAEENKETKKEIINEINNSLTP
jgi:GABA(A) receptor-associated protein